MKQAEADTDDKRWTVQTNGCFAASDYADALSIGWQERNAGDIIPPRLLRSSFLEPDEGVVSVHALIPSTYNDRWTSSMRTYTANQAGFDKYTTDYHSGATSIFISHILHFKPRHVQKDVYFERGFTSYRINALLNNLLPQNEVLLYFGNYNNYHVPAHTPLHCIEFVHVDAEDVENE